MLLLLAALALTPSLRAEAPGASSDDSAPESPLEEPAPLPIPPLVRPIDPDEDEAPLPSSTSLEEPSVTASEATPGAAETTNTDTTNTATTNTDTTSIAPPAELAAAEASVKLPVVQRLQTLITVDFRDVSLQSALDFLAQSADVNIVPGQDVDVSEARVTMRFKDLAMVRALKYLLNNQGLTYRIDQEAVVILGPGDEEREALETRLFPLQYGAGNFATFPATTSLGTTKEATLGSSSGSVQFTTIKDSLDAVVPTVSGSALLLDTRSNTLIATNTPKNLRLIEQLLESLDRPSYQVLIEARLMDVSITDLSELGMSYTLTDPFTLKKQTQSGSTSGSQTPTAILESGGGISYGTFSRSTDGFNLTLQGILTRPQYQATLHALKERANAKTLSVPSVLTANRQAAVVKFVDEFIYASRFEPTVEFGAEGANDATFVLAPQDFVTRDIGILLNVTPDVGADGKTVTLSLAPEVSEAVADFFTFSGTASFPKFTTRTVNTEVVIRDGETVLLGGLIKETRTKTRTGVPGLSRIPILRRLVDHDTETSTRSNLLIFVTVHVVPGGAPMMANAQDASILP